MKISSFARAMGIGLLAAVIAIIGITGLNLDRLKIGGGSYNRIIASKDLTADILPPPLYVIEAYALALEAGDQKDLAGPAAARIGELRTAFNERLLYWKTAPLDPAVRALIQDRIAPSADRFWTVALKDLLPAVSRGDAIAAEAARQSLKQAYGGQRAAVDELIPVAARAALATEATARAGVMQTVWAVSLMAGLMVLLVLGNLIVTQIRVIRPMAGMKDYMLRLSGGDLAVATPFLNRGDEIGDMAKAVQVFRQNALALVEAEIQRLDLEKAASEARGRVEEERLRAADEQKAVVEAVAGALSRLAEADVTVRLNDLPAGYRKLQEDYNRALDVLQETLTSVSRVVESFSTGTHQIAQASDDLSRRTEQQAASLEQTAAALDQITVTVTRSADGAAKAAALVSTTRDEAHQSGRIVREAVTAMGEIERSSSQITQIIGVIDEISFQTNLLALNAGVEAARAGEAGRGFAVVAQEVRALAQRSADAAKEIKGLIGASSGRVLDGVRLVGQTGEALERIVLSVGSIDGLVRDFAVSAHEQSTGLAEVNVAVNQMDQVTQQNAAMVEQATAATQSLRNEADDLAKLVGRFKVSASTGSQGSPSVRPAAVDRPPPPRQARRLAVAGSSSGGAMRRQEGWEEF
jgi:methyl-accepting chemotaxis protein